MGRELLVPYDRDLTRRFVHVAQHSGGQLIGGVSLELRPRKK
jgi:hypothetical protein